MKRFVLMVIFAWLPVSAAAVPYSVNPATPLQREWKAHRGLPWDMNPLVPYTVGAPIHAEGGPDFTVLGYLPYWVLGDATLVLHLDQLDVIAYFGAELLADGTVGEVHHWGGVQMDALIADAHAAGVKVVLTVVNFDPDSMHAVLATQTSVTKAVDTLTALVAENGGDGVNVDFEGLPVADKEAFVGFIEALKAAMDEALGGSHVSIATPAVDWSGAFDYDKLAQACDALMIMGYDYHWKNGDPGPVSPLNGSAKWGKYALDWTVDDYLEWGLAENRHKFILGLPLYGFDWPAIGQDVPSKATGPADALFYARCQDEAVLYGWQWDDESSTPYYVYKSDGWRQVWCEDMKSLAMKYLLAADNDLGGVGFWALGYEEDRDDVWYELAHVFPPSIVAEQVPEEAVAEEVGDVVEHGPETDADLQPDFIQETVVGRGSGCSVGAVSTSGPACGFVLLMAAMALIFTMRRSTMSGSRLWETS
ncbi:MAG: hypothetical protein GXP54_13960 [Deltaproteobacteria bacterium]|nr:hypothetical protein [Deltaproteobacteria bacterium]